FTWWGLGRLRRPSKPPKSESPSKEKDMLGHSFPDLTDHLDIHPTSYISPHAYVHGTVSIGADSSVWPMVVIRGDKGVIAIGAGTNIQDGSVLHADPDAYLTI